MTGKNNSRKRKLQDSPMKNFIKKFISENTTNQNNRIPEEIQLSILQNLPGKALMRFKCVSKAWNSMISDPNFISEPPQLILCSHLSIFLMNCEVSSTKATKLNLPIKAEKRRFLSVMASCNGILWIKVNQENLLWNPFTGEQKIIPNDPSHLGAPALLSTEGYGFGYDHTTKDFKIVCIPTSYSRKQFIYSVKNDSFENLEKIIPYYSDLAFDEIQGISMKNGNFLYWPIVYFCDSTDRLLNRRYDNSSCAFCHEGEPRKPHMLILEFDLVNRKQVLFPQPFTVYNLDDPREHVKKLMDFKGSLCAVIEDHINQITDLWLLMEDKCQQNWVKFMSIDLDFWAEPIYIKSDGEVLMIDFSREKIVFYDHNGSKNRFQSVEIMGIDINEVRMWNQQITYRQTLASIQS